MQESEPGNIISPSSIAPEEPEQTPVNPPAPSAPQDDLDVAVPPPQPVEAPVTSAQPEPHFETSVQQKTDQPSVTWQAAEYGAGVRSNTWYVFIVFGAALLSAVVYFLNKDVITAVLVLVALVGLAFATGKKPRQQEYVIDNAGIRVGNKSYYYHDFHSFSVSEDAQASSIILTPLKRFMPAVNVYVPIEYEDRVVAVIGDILPMEHYKPDFVEKLTDRLHF